MATPTNLPATFVDGNTLPASQLNALRGAFRILQVVQGTTTTATSSSTSTYVDTTLTATITPQSSTSNILIMVAQNGCHKSNANPFTTMNLQLLRGATVLQTIGAGLGYTGNAEEASFCASTTYLDSPATTSATTYKTQMSSPFNQATATTQRGSVPSNIILMEVSA
jgi:hypothetical protein